MGLKQLQPPLGCSSFGGLAPRYPRYAPRTPCADGLAQPPGPSPGGLLPSRITGLEFERRSDFDVDPATVHNAAMLWLWLFACDFTLYANLPEVPSGDTGETSGDTATSVPSGDTGG